MKRRFSVIAALFGLLLVGGGALITGTTDTLMASGGCGWYCNPQGNACLEGDSTVVSYCHTSSTGVCDHWPTYCPGPED